MPGFPVFINVNQHMQELKQPPHGFPSKVIPATGVHVQEAGEATKFRFTQEIHIRSFN